ncbi:hypothetical protein ABH940_000839 [Streptacidiphilus sp. BW17]|uniref:hypothetical protein n=1 Tax=Streptacidiphilus sp. BW17 TaxID=3156274 RepID=UPI0035153058
MQETPLPVFAQEMLSLAPYANCAVNGSASARSLAFAAWIGSLYGYTFYRADYVTGGRYDVPTRDLIFSRNDDPGARRRAEWMRNPAGDPAYPPPVRWHLNGGFGFNPPGWHPAVRLIETPEVDSFLRSESKLFVKRLHLSWLNR